MFCSRHKNFPKLMLKKEKLNLTEPKATMAYKSDIFSVGYSSFVAFSVSSFFSTWVVSLGSLFTYSEGKISMFSSDCGSN